MPWPTPQDYNEAVQNPHLAFSDPELKSGQPELNNLGLPRPFSGNFACVYKIRVGAQKWAARCFTSDVPDQQQRYEAISNYLSKVALPYTVPFTYLASGIKVRGIQYPLLKMKWIEGEPLTAFVGRMCRFPETLLSVAAVWARLAADLQRAQIAHGDLQHGNILVVGDQLRLIDYDGMYVPALAGRQSNECGHRNYQLPSRTGWDFGPHIDNFSVWVIYVSLVSLAVHPELWNKYNGGDECLIFRKDDFVNPDQSALLAELSASSNTQLRYIVELFATLFRLSSHDVPSLDGDIATVTVSSRAQLVDVSTGANWWNDHREAKSETSVPLSRDDEQEVRAPSTLDATWVFDSILDKEPVERLSFKGDFRNVRIVACGTAALWLVMQLFLQIPPSDLVISAFGAFGLNMLLCFVSYRRDPALDELEAFKAQAKEFREAVSKRQKIVDAIAAERAVVHDQFVKKDQTLKDQRNALANELQLSLASAQNELSSQFQSLAQRRQGLSSSETNKLNSLQGSLGNRIADLGRKIGDLRQREQDERTQLFVSLQESHVQTALRRTSVSTSSISGFGPAYKSRLMNFGILTAEDVDRNAGRIHGIGSARLAALLHWRQQIEAEARRTFPGLTNRDMVAVEAKYRQERHRLDTEKQSLQTQFNAQVIDVRKFFADARQELVEEEHQLKQIYEQKQIATKQDYNFRIAQVDTNIATAAAQAAGALKELSNKLGPAQKEVFALRWQCAKHANKGQRFDRLKFKSYLRQLVSL